MPSFVGLDILRFRLHKNDNTGNIVVMSIVPASVLVSEFMELCVIHMQYCDAHSNVWCVPIPTR